jgi:hypothetical protein
VRAGLACVPAGRSGRPRPARAGAVRPAAQSRLGDQAGLVKISVLTRGPQATEIGGVRWLRGLVGPEGCTGWAGWIE